MSDKNMTEKPKLKIPRSVAAVAISASLLAGCAPSQAQNPDSSTSPQTTAVTTPETKLSWQSEQLSPNEQFMSGQEANQIAKKLGISTDSFFKFPSGEAFWQQPEILNALSNETIIPNIDQYNLPPIFPPSVLKWQPEILAAVKAVYQRQGVFVPPEVVAFTMTAESAGLPGVDSPEAHINDIGIGLMQVLKSNMKHYLGQGFPDERLFEPSINVLVGTMMLADGMVAALENDLTSATKQIGYGPFMAKVIAYYNAGPNGINLEHTELLENYGYRGTVIYRDDSQRFLMSCAIANQLRQAGFSDSQIVDQMSSVQVDAKAYALNILLVRRGDASAYNQILDEVTRPQDFPEAAQLIQEYLDNPIWITPQNPALRIFCKRGGDWLFLQSDENTDPKFYQMTPEEIRQYLDSQSQYTPHETTQQRDTRRGYSPPKKSSRPHGV